MAALEGGRAGCELIILGFVGGTVDIDGMEARVDSLVDDAGSLFGVSYAIVQGGEQLGNNVEVALDEFVGMTEECAVPGL